MNTRRLKALLDARGLSQAELARRVGVTRQAVSLWLRQSGEVDVRGSHLLAVARVLGVPVDELVRPLPSFEPEQHRRLMSELLWDRLYPDLDDFAAAVGRGEHRALARLVEVYGLYRAAKMAGEIIWRAFPDYARYLHPVRRAQLEELHRWRETNQTAA